MCRLFCRIANAMEAIEQNFEQHVITQATILLEQAEDAARDKKRGRKDIASLQQEAIASIVIELHALHAKYLQYVSGYFMNHYAFHKALRQSFELICNKELAGSKHAKSVVTFFDNILKKGGSENLCHEDIENTLEKVDDLKLARESQTNFEVYLNDNANISLGIDLTVTILTTSFWPSYKSFELNLPLEMAKCVDSFKDFYQTKTKDRKLKWIYSLGKCNVIGMFDAKPIELIVTPCQAAALLLFNASEKMSYLDIKSQLNLIDEDIVRLLHSLACAKYKILNKTPDTKVFAPTDYFEFNAAFTDRKGRIKIPLSPPDERKKVNEDVDKKRHHAIDASIVRIMKPRKILPYQQLVNKCVEQLAHMFKPDFQAIQRQIEDLIGNE